MADICEYTDYRKFLGDYYEETKAKSPGFSYQMFAQKAGFTSKGFLYLVVQGKRPLSRANILGISQAMKLDKHQTDYFENLVAFNQATTLQERNRYFEKMTSIKATGKSAWKPQLVRNEQFEFYSRLHHSVVRALIEQRRFKDDYAFLAKAVRPRITPKQARESVRLLAKLGFIKKRKDDTWAVTDKTITTPPEVSSLAVQNLHREAGELALKALNDLPKDKRNITGLTLGISLETYKTVCEEINAFRERLLQIAEADQKANAVYQLNFQFYPVSETNSKRISE
jgi:uncharacterized protein (TIGR02147 family)